MSENTDHPAALRLNTALDLFEANLAGRPLEGHSPLIRAIFSANGVGVLTLLSETGTTRPWSLQLDGLRPGLVTITVGIASRTSMLTGESVQSKTEDRG